MERRAAPRFPCSPEGIEAVTAEFERIARRLDLPRSIRRDVVVSLDEMLSNVVKYAHEDDMEHRFSFYCDRVGEVLEVLLIYSGREFDPTTVTDPRTDQDLDDRPVGGLGIFLVKNLMDDIVYRRQGRLNYLTIRKRIASGAAD